MDLWRISNYADLRGIGGLKVSGRWHIAGLPVVYLAEHPAGALLEMLVHAEIGSPADLPDTYQLLRVAVPDAITVAEISESDMPENWREEVAFTQGAGNEWLTSGTSILLKVPSAVLPYAYNYVMNPAHPEAAMLQIVMAIQVKQDPRILKLLTG